jgi:hypothetical protein
MVVTDIPSWSQGQFEAHFGPEDEDDPWPSDSESASATSVDPSAASLAETLNALLADLAAPPPQHTPARLERLERLAERIGAWIFIHTHGDPP